MKIVVLGTRGFPNVQGGVEAHCENLYPCLVKQGCDVTVITRRPYVDLGVTSYRDVRLVALNCPQNKFLEAFIHTFKGVLLARKMGCDILHIHSIGPSLFVPMAKLLGLKVVMTHHGPDYERKKWNGLAKLVLMMGEWKGCVFANEIIAISKTIADHIKKNFGRTANQIPNGVLIPQQIGTDGALKRFGIEKGKYILTVGRFVPEKGFEDLVNAFQLGAGSNFAGYKLVVVGDADHIDKYSTKLKEKANQVKGVILTGRLTGMPLQELYTHAGLFVLPSYYEGLPIVLLEALSYGLSCLVSDISSNREVGLDSERYFPAGDVDTMAKIIVRFLARTQALEEKDLQIKRISEKYSWEKISAETFKVYKKICM
ncbi:MAG: glycosyltransferase family 4 protein [Candidatus Omnitrophica bacterium]|nr:glycosyltransferase family 4 protein [Candidatus Omnitrophota bacterium]